MELSSDSISNLLQQEINDTNNILHQFQFNEEEMKEYQKKQQIKKRAQQKLENLMKRKLYKMEKERLNEMEEINQPKDIYPILSKMEKYWKCIQQNNLKMLLIENLKNH